MTSIGVMASSRSAADRLSSLAQLALAIRDIAVRDDIHQAALRLEFVLQWIRDEAERAARDPIFADLTPVHVVRSRSSAISLEQRLQTLLHLGEQEGLMHRILVVDDDRTLLTTIGRILRSCGYDAHFASDGLEGLRSFRTIKPDLVITDINMPVKEGLDMIVLLRTWVPEQKVIVITGGGHSSKMDPFLAARAAGAWGVVAKPFGPDELLTVVAECLAAPSP